jgi:hypothetical protein
MHNAMHHCIDVWILHFAMFHARRETVAINISYKIVIGIEDFTLRDLIPLLPICQAVDLSLLAVGHGTCSVSNLLYKFL